MSTSMNEKFFSAYLFNSLGGLDFQRLGEIRHQYHTNNYLHVINTGIKTTQDLLALMPELGFSDAEEFRWGGRTSEDWQGKWIAPGLRRMDYYPEHLYLLPNNEIQYQRVFPERLLFFCSKLNVHFGGRTFVHDAKKVEYLLLKSNTGRHLMDKLKQHGVLIETGFLDRRHPEKKNNYFQSWQERFVTDSLDEAIYRCQLLTSEFDAVWSKKEAQTSSDGSPVYTLMTQIKLPAFAKDPRDGEYYLRFPRIAQDGPSLINGYRRFLLGNNQPLNDAEKQILIDSYYDSRQGIHWSEGDFILLDNIRYGHSREAFLGTREVYIGMAGTCLLKEDKIAFVDIQEKKNNTYVPPMPKSCKTTTSTAERYRLPSNEQMWQEQFAMRVFDMQGDLTTVKLKEAQKTFQEYGIVQIINTGGYPKDWEARYNQILDHLGFQEHEQFVWGGRVSGRTLRAPLAKFLRATDLYPRERVLLAHNEILYQRFIPKALLFWCIQPKGRISGGRTFVHCSRQVEKYISASGPVGMNLLEKLKKYGFMIESGFLDENHPLKEKNYFRSWQNRFETQCIEEAKMRCLASKYQFDDCWSIKEDDGPWFTLMTRIFIPAYTKNPDNGHSYLLFPRIALDGPCLENGYRRFTLGNGEELGLEEIDVLLESYWKSRQGWHYKEGDILLVNNLCFGHSRESYEGERIIGVSMAGVHWTDDVTKKMNIENEF